MGSRLRLPLTTAQDECFLYMELESSCVERKIVDFFESKIQNSGFISRENITESRSFSRGGGPPSLKCLHPGELAGCRWTIFF